MTAQHDFQAALAEEFRFHNYGWSVGKERSCQWIMSRIESGRCVDVGGTTWLVRSLRARGIPCTYFDAFPPASTEGLGDVVLGDLQEIADRLPRRAFDTVTCRHTLEHARDPLFVLWQINQLLVDDGRAVIVVPRHRDYWVWYYTHFSCLPMENWRMLFYRAGFRIVEESHGHWDDDGTNDWMVEERIVLQVQTRKLRLQQPKPA